MVVETVEYEFSADTNKFVSSVKNAEGATSSLSGVVKGAGQSINNLADETKYFSAAAIAVGGVATKTAIDFTKLYESTLIVFESMLGGKDAANELYTSLLDIAKASTYSQETFLEAGKRLIGMGVSAERTKQYLQAATNAVAGFGGSAQNIDSITNAFAKATASGRLNMEVVNMLSDNGVNALQILGNQYGVTTQEIQKMISNGALPAEEALDKLTDGIQNGTDGANGMTKAMDGMAATLKGGSLTGAMDSLGSAVRSFSLELIGINPTLRENDEGYEESQQKIQGLIAAFSTVSEILPKIARLFSGFTDGIGNFITSLVGANATIDEATGKWTNVGGILGNLNQALDNMDPKNLQRIGNAIIGLVALAPIVKTFNKFQRILTVLTAPINNVVKAIAKKRAAMLADKVATDANSASTSVATAVTGTFGTTANATSKSLFAMIAPIVAIVAIIALLVAGFISLYNSSEEFRAVIDEFVNTVLTGLSNFITTVLIPAFNSFVSFIINTVIPALSSLWTFFMENIMPILAAVVTFVLTELIPAIGSFISSIAEILLPILQTLWTLFADYIIPILTELFNFIVENIVPIFVEVANIVGDVLGPVLSFLWDIIKVLIDAFSVFATWIGDVIGKFQNAITEFKKTDAFKTMKTVIDNLAGAFQTLFGWIGDALGALGDFVSFIGDVGSSVGDFFGDLFGSDSNISVRGMQSFGKIGQGQSMEVHNHYQFNVQQSGQLDKSSIFMLKERTQNL